MTKKKAKRIEIMEDRAMIYLPHSAVEVTIEAKIYEHNDLQTVRKKLNMDEIKQAFKDAEDNYIGPDDTYVITERGERYLNELLDKTERVPL